MNEQLRFSWGHIIAFVALIIISYITFVGVTYITDGNFAKASVTMVIVDVVLFVFFIGAQMMKATTKKFYKRIWVERFFVFSSPLVFLVCMLPFYHFCTVQSQDDEIASRFADAITTSKQMFSDYDSYSKKRIDNYGHMLDQIISNRSIQPYEFASCGFTNGYEQIQRDNMVKALQLQLISENYDSLKTVATKWIESSSKGASTWNVFLLGNIREIKKAIHEWNAQLAEFSKHKMTNEEFNGYNQVSCFADFSGSLAFVDTELESLTDNFTSTAFPSVGSILVSFIFYLVLLLPYFLQDRHTKNLLRLFGQKKGATCLQSIAVASSKHKERRATKKEVESYENNNESASTNPNVDNETDDYEPFTM